MNKHFKLIEVRPRIFLLDFKKRYDLCMYFVRYQEFYECPSSRFRGKDFKLLDYMDWYANKYGEGCFTYPIQWSGFNIPGDIIKKVWELGIADRNRYDYEMLDVYKRCAQQYPHDPFYIIGAQGDMITRKHEMAHAFFYIQRNYKQQMTKLVGALKPKFHQEMCQTLKKLGYTPKVYTDECQAYLSTGLSDVFDIKLKGEDKPFRALYNEYYHKSPT